MSQQTQNQNGRAGSERIHRWRGWPEYLCYDDDGNLLQSGKPTANCDTKDGAWKHVWNGKGVRSHFQQRW